MKTDHIGSTAVPGLATKLVIDIVLTVIDTTDEKYVSALESLGYKLIVHEPRLHGYRLFYYDSPKTNLHILLRTLLKQSVIFFFEIGYYS